MGQAQTTEQKVNTAKSNIENLHIEVQKLEQVINQEVDKLEKDIANANYTDLNKLCDQIGYQYVDRLSSHFPITILEGYGKIKLGLQPQPVTENMENYKQSVCKNIVAFYKKKLFLLEQIRKETPKCQTMERSVFNNLSEKLRSEGIDTEQWLEVYKKMQKFNKDIKYQYSKISNSVQKIRNSQTWAQLNSTSKDTIELVNDTNSICTRYQADLNRFRQLSPPTKPLPEIPSEFGPKGAAAPGIPPLVNPVKASAETPSESGPKGAAAPGIPPLVNPVKAEIPSESAAKGSIASDIPPLEKPVTVKIEPVTTSTDVKLGSQAVLTEDFSYKNASVAVKGDVVEVLKYDNKGWAQVRSKDGNIKYVPKKFLVPK